MKKKILFLVPLPPPIYGAAVSSRLCLKSKALNREFDIEHIRLNYSQSLGDVGKPSSKKFFGFFSVFFCIFKRIVSFKPDLVYFTIAPSGSGFIRDSFFVGVCKLFRKNIIFHLRGRIKHAIGNPLMKLLYKLVYRNTKVIILNECLYDEVRDFVPRKNVFILPNAIENEVVDIELRRIVEKRKKNKISNILFLSNMDETKGPMILLKACKILKNKRIKFKCNFAGEWVDDEFRKVFESYIKSNNLGGVIEYVGKKYGKGKGEILIKSNILAFPTYYKLETFGLVILEAMQYGLPVVANGIASIPSIVIHGKTGFVLKKNNPEELAKYLKFLIKNKSTSLQLGKNGRKRFLEKYCFSEYELKLKSVFEDILESEKV